MTAPQLDLLVGPARELAQQSLDWTDQFWDEAAGLLRAPANELYEAGETAQDVHLVRETVWYALALLLRDGAGDRERASHAIATVLQYQFDTPTTPYHGTWRRSPEEPLPPANPVIWQDYDPNWRDFIGTALAVILIEYESRLPRNLVDQIDAALRLAIDGTIARNVPASYTNIALMTAFLLQFGADRFNMPEWAKRSEQLATAVLDLFRVNNTFDEYNSPTYYGIDLYALALWRRYGGSSLLRAAGAEMEAALWHDIAQFYHADLRNVAGPYDRSYGMDMRRYVSCLGLWIWLTTGREHAPFPAEGEPLEHAWDFVLGPVVALLGLQMPDDARPHFSTFLGERQLERIITTEPRRVATAYIGKSVIIGGQDSGGTHRLNEQYHPATIHWLIGEDSGGWLQLLPTAPIDARVEGETLYLSCTNHPGGDIQFAFRIAAPGIENATFQTDRWMLPGMNVSVTTTAEEPHISSEGNTVLVQYVAQDCAPNAPLALTLWVAQP